MPILYVPLEDYDAVKAERDKLQLELCDAREATCIVRMQDYMDLDTVPAIRKLYELWQEAVHRPQPVAVEQCRALVLAVEFIRNEHRDMLQYCERVIEEIGKVQA